MADGLSKGVPAGGELSGRHLLVVEDDYLIATEMAAALSARGATIIGPAGSVSEARALLDGAAASLDGAVLDINLNGERVFPIADVLAARGVPFVFATGYDLSVIPQPYADAPRCVKPVRISVLVRLLTERIGKEG